SSAFHNESPISCADTGERVPTYLIPLEVDDRERLFFWMREYRRLDGVWLASGDLENPAYEQTASPHSMLSQQGRELARKVEEAIGVPTYYFLTRYYGRSEGEEDRRCPGCSGEWRIENTPQRVPGYLNLDFRCERCRLISYDAVEEDEQRAHIGEYDSSSNTDRP
ncbi:MAG: DUF2310 family Zn-ribbon-containing protein, partial [Planctomycetaceae bacterium]|nr:DUF2310 family Zn-ribbon-containing protein [Planctomycetaceae bacterium]